MRRKVRNAVCALALAAGAVVFAASRVNAETVVDLTGPVPQTTTINGAIYTTNVQQPTGTGVIRPFVRLDAQGKPGIESGYNTDARPLESGNDAKADFQYTHSLALSSLVSTNIGGVDYYQFLLDINQTGSSPLLNLNDLQLYVSSSANLTGYTGSGFSSGSSTEVYNIDATTDKGLLLNYSLNSGSGSGDLYVFVPKADFNVANNTYVYLYSSFGRPNVNNDGFEEWAAVVGANTPPTVPLPASLWGGLALLGFLGVAKIRSRRQSA